MFKPKPLTWTAALAGVLLCVPALAQMDESTPTDTSSEAMVDDAVGTADTTTDEASASKAMQDLLGSRQAPPVTEPDLTPKGPSEEPIGPAASIDIDPAVLGIAPGEEPPPLRREGEFIINRRGRLIRSAESGHPLFVLESDSEHSPELPMVLQACQLLETMEDTVGRRGDTTVFILSGQVHTYRGANYLLPTMMNIASDSGNLTN